MTTVDEIKAAIQKLTPAERAEVAKVLYESDDEWDRQMRQDAASGKLDALLDQVRDDIRNNRLEEGP